MSDTQTAPISFDEFLKFLSKSLFVEVDELSPDTSFVNDLQVDSVRWLEMAIMIDELGVELPPDVFWDIQTVSDAYDIYVQYFNQSN
ncbi:acyl carrier protein [Chloroflexota bacterium]